MKKFLVMKKRCDQCLFSKGKVVSDERKKQVLEKCISTGKYFACHKAQKVCCKGFFDSGLTQNVQVLARLYERGYSFLIEWVECPETETEINTES